MTTATVRLLTPEIVLIAAAVAIYLGGAFSTARWPWSWIAATAVVLAGSALWMQHGLPAPGGPIAVDALSWFARWLALTFAALLVLLTFRPLATGGTSEYAGSLLLTIAGLMLVAEAADLVLLFVSLELISIPTYVLLCLGRRDAQCQESATKYFFLSVLASSILLYGFSFLYGISGSTQLADIRAALEASGQLPPEFDALARLALVLVFAGLCFKIAAVPFHFYAPDVYQGTTHPNAALLSVIPKTAGLVAMVRLLVIAMPGMEPYSWRIALALSVLTMTFGNVMALWQDDLRRLLAYSSIAHAGYLLIGLAVGLAAPPGPSNWDGLGAMWFYLAAYAAATIGAFAVFEHLGRPDRRVDAVDELAGLGRTRPLAAALVAVFMFSLAGIPPLAGFWGKLLLFGSALSTGDAGAGLRPWFLALAVIGVLNAAVAAAYYLRIVAVMYFRAPLATPRAEGGRGAWLAAVACALLVIGIGFYPGPLMRESNEAGIRSQESGMNGEGAGNSEARMTKSECLFRHSSFELRHSLPPVIEVPPPQGLPRVLERRT